MLAESCKGPIIRVVQSVQPPRTRRLNGCVRTNCLRRCETSDMPVSQSALQEYQRTAINAAKEAGAVITAAFTKEKQVEHKGAVDLVTETDKACEELIFTALHRAFPDHRFIGEEGSSAQGFTDSLTDEPTWMCDPLDGTTNFVHRFPNCCVSLALVIDKKIVVGVVYSPILDELFVAIKGQGAALNGRPIKVSRVDSLGSALFATEIGVTRDPATVSAIFARIAALCQKTRSMRALGSCALDLCSVACGRLDIMYEIGFGGCWDCAAGALIVEEAGGMVLDPTGGAFDVMARRVLAGNRHVAKEAARVLAGQPLGPQEPKPS